jgi:hypothetical protein
MIRKIASVAALAIAAVPMVALTANIASANSNAVTVSAFNQGGYMVTFEVSYTVDGTRKTVNSGGLAVGQKIYFQLPANSRSVRMMAVGRSMYPAEKAIIISEENARNGSCFKTFGTSSNPQWSRRCPASDSFFYSGITRVFTKVAQ